MGRRTSSLPVIGPYMTTPEAMSDTAPAKPAPLWEDFIDIFYAPSEVFARRRNSSPWPMILIITALIVLLSVLTFSSMINVIEPMARRSMEKAMESNPQFTQDMMEANLRRGMKVAPWMPVFAPVLMMLGAVVVWLVGKVFGSKASYTQSLLIVAYACITFVVGYLVTGAQALVMDMTKLTNPVQLSLSPARFVDPATASPWTYGFLTALDVFSLWRTALLAIGLRVIGGVSKGQAWAFAITMFVILVLFSVRNAFQMVG